MRFSVLQHVLFQTKLLVANIASKRLVPGVCQLVAEEIAFFSECFWTLFTCKRFDGGVRIHVLLKRSFLSEGGRALVTLEPLDA